MQVPFDVLVDGFNFVEAPRNAPDGSVYFSELIEGGLYRHNPDGSVATILSDRRWIGGLVINRDGSVICSGEGGLVRVYPETGRVEPLLAEVDGKPVIAINDIEAGPTGGIYGGTVDFKAILEDGTEPSPGAFFLLRPDGELRIIHRDLVASNGMGFSPDLRRLYHSESPKGVWVHELDDQGLPGDRKMIVTIDDGDGLVVDAEEHIWLARWNSGQIIRYQPDGAIERVIELPFPNIVSLDFGGPDLRDLIVSTGGTDEATGRKIGGLIRIRTDVPGQRTFQAGF